jgi:uncharacterized protein (TIGR02265 family)
MNVSAAKRDGAQPVTITAPDFAARLEQVTPGDTAKGMFFNGVLDAVAKLVGPEAPAICLASAGEKRKFIDFFNYPIGTFLQLAFTAVELISEAGGTLEEGFFRLGAQATSDFLATGVGKTLLLLAGKDPGRLIAALPGAYKTAVSYGERKAEAMGKGAYRLTVRRDFMPGPYHEGVLDAVVRAMGWRT